MNIIHSTSPFLPLKPAAIQAPPIVHCTSQYTFGCYTTAQLSSSYPIRSLNVILNPPRVSYSFRAATPSSQEAVSLVDFEDFQEKDWSFLDNFDGDHTHKIDRIISAGEIAETSKVLISIASESFVDRVVSSSPCEQLLAVHDSLFILACIKEKYDRVNCWQGELISVPEKWTPFDVVFLYFLPALPFELDRVLAALANRCFPGARIVISHPEGRQVLEEQQRQHPDVVVSNLPEKTTLQRVASENSLEVVEFVDEPGFYLAVLRCSRE